MGKIFKIATILLSLIRGHGIFTPQKPNLADFGDPPFKRNASQLPLDNRYMTCRSMQAVQRLGVSLSNYVRTDHEDAILCVLYIKDSIVATGKFNKKYFKLCYEYRNI